MSNKLPADFDAYWYAATYPDVALSGLDPRDHYRRFGALLGRKPKGTSPPAQKSAATPSEPVKERPKPPAAPDAPEASPASPPKAKRAKGSPIIDRPQGFDPLTTVPKPAPPRTGADPKGQFNLDNVATLADGSDRPPFAVAQALHAYARLLNVQGPGWADDVEARFSCGSSPFRAGATRIERAWFADSSRLRLMVTGGTESAKSQHGEAVRAYQALPASPADLRILGQGVQLPAVGPLIHDFELLHPLMPLLLELTGEDGSTRAMTLLPFPSLLPGGLHGAELKALQTEPDPMEDLWALSDDLLNEAFGGEDGQGRSVSHIRIAGDGATTNPAAQTPLIHDWLSAVFGIDVEATNAPTNDAFELVLPSDFVPTISALVSRRLPQCGSVTGPYLVAEVDGYRPRWSIVLPADPRAGDVIPILRRGGAVDPAPGLETAPIPLAIAIRSPTAPPSRKSADVPRSAGPEAMSVLVYASDEPRVERLIRSVQTAVGREVQWFARLDHSDGALDDALDRACGGAWTRVPSGADLRQIARDARHDTLLTVSDGIELDDGEGLHAVLDLLQRDEATGSASCALLAEKVIKKEVVLQPASAGLFPTGVSFVSGPRLAFGEPDALQALPDLTYPVVANTLLLTAWRRRALVELPPVPGAGSASTEDIRLGLDLIRAGYRNWCTTKVTARLSKSYVRRDAIDPVGAGYLPPERWDEILGRVTIVRELF